MPAVRTIPDELTTEEAAEWFDSHDTSELTGELISEPRRRGMALKTVSVRLSEREVEELERRAELLGVGYTTYIRMLVNRHLRREKPLL